MTSPDHGQADLTTWLDNLFPSRKIADQISGVEDAVMRRATCLTLAVLALPADTLVDDLLRVADYLDRGVVADAT